MPLASQISAFSQPACRLPFSCSLSISLSALCDQHKTALARNDIFGRCGIKYHHYGSNENDNRHLVELADDEGSVHEHGNWDDSRIVHLWSGLHKQKDAFSCVSFHSIFP